jgi:hypothetical protein
MDLTPLPFEPIDIRLERAGAATREKQSRRRPTVSPYFSSTPMPAAPPEAFDEVFAKLAHAHPGAPNSTTATPAKPSLDAAPLHALAASLERQHQRLAALLRELESGVAK